MKEVLVSGVIGGQEEPENPTRVAGGSGYEVGNGGRWWVGGGLASWEEIWVGSDLGGGGGG